MANNGGRNQKPNQNQKRIAGPGSIWAAAARAVVHRPTGAAASG